MTTSQGQFQLFPPTQPQNRPNNPPKKHRRRSTRSPTVSPVLENTKAAEQTEALILKIIEDTNAGIPSQDTHQLAANSPVSRSASSNSQRNWSSRSGSKSPDTQSSTSPSSQRNAASSSPGTAPSLSIPPLPPLGLHFEGGRRKDTDTKANTRPKSPTAPINIPESKRSIDMVRGISPPLPAATPPIPMRSIFPRYDPNIPLDQQHYYPDGGRPQYIAPRAVSLPDYKPGNAFSRHGTHRSQSGITPMAVPLEGLKELWNVTSGEQLGNELDTYHLRMKRVDSLTYTFGSDSLPFYTLNANSTNDIELHKSDPSEENTKSPVTTLNLGDLEPDSDSPVPIALFPKMAGIQAREQSAEISKREQLSSSQAVEAENDAVRRVEAQETCTLEWRSGKTSYNVYYQALKPRNTNRLSASRESTNRPGLLHASISSPSRQSTSYHPTILITIPEETTIRTLSPHPKTTGTPLVALDLESATLSIFASSILPKIPSLYSIDMLVSAIITVALTNEPTRAVMAKMDIYEPKAEDFPDPYRLGPNSPRPSGSSFQRYTGNIVTTTNPTDRKEAEQEASLMRQIRSQKSKDRIKFSWPWKRPRMEVKEIDLEANLAKKTRMKEEANATNNNNTPKNGNHTKPPVSNSLDIGRYRDFNALGNSHAGEQLPKPTQAALKFLFWIFSLIVYALSRSVKFLAWLLVRTTRCLSSKKA